MTSLTLSCIQMNSGDDVAENIAALTPMLQEARAQEAELIALPENAFLMATGERFHTQIYAQEEHPAVLAMQEQAAHLGVWILIGSVMCHADPPHPASSFAKASEDGSAKAHPSVSPSLRNPPPQGGGKQGGASSNSLPLKGEGWGGGEEAFHPRYANRSILIDADGKIVAAYDKIHLFDVTLPSGESHFESKRIAAGDRAVIAETPWGKLGMSVCYDVRFPQLYRTLAKAGADFLSVPAAFTRFTGKKGGWHVLTRARAMETGCFLFAPAQCGEHPGASDRKTYGHSLIIDPWGSVLAEAGESPEILTTTIDPAKVATTRAVMPSLQHDREFTVE